MAHPHDGARRHRDAGGRRPLTIAAAAAQAPADRHFAVKDYLDLEQVADPQIAPDGRTIYFVSDRGGGPQIYRMGAGGGEVHEGEDIEVLEMPFDEMRRMVQDGRIVDAKTVLLSLFLERELGLPPL